MNTLDLEKVLHHEIPLTTAMGISVKALTPNSVSLVAPLNKNINHKSTAFGGSLYSICVLTGWSLLYSKLDSLGERGHIVIQESNIQYLLPVTTDIETVCTNDNEVVFDRAIRMYQKKGRARFILATKVFQNDHLAVSFEGKYVVHR